MRSAIASVSLFGLLYGLSTTASAAEVTRVASSFEEEDPFDLHFGVGYAFDFKKAAILREWSQQNGDESILAKDLIYRQTRQTVTPSLEIGIYKDVSIYAALPIVVSDNRNYAFDQEEGSECIYADEGGSLAPTCVNKSNSSSIRDNIIPNDGWDATAPASAYDQFTGQDTELIFLAPTRRGLDQVHVGLKWGLMNQEKRSHLPTWLVGFEGRFAIAKPMTFTRDIDQEDPAGNTRVGRGMHELGVWTALSRRYRFLEPYFTAYWRQSLRASNTEFQSFPGAQDKVNPQSQTGLSFGAEIIPWERKTKQQKVSFILTGTADLIYGGRNYSEIWELLADSPAMVGTPDPGNTTCNPLTAVGYANNPTNANPDGYLDAANAAAGSGCIAHNGITDVEDYAIFGMNLALNFHLGPYARLNFGGMMRTNTRHFLTAANRGDPELASGPGTDPGRVDADTIEVNPVRRDVVDSVGRRYAIDDVFNAIGTANFLITF